MTNPIVLGPFPLDEIMEERSRRKRRGHPQPDAAAATLRERWEELNRTYDLKPGDIVIHKAGWDQRNRDLMNQPMLLLGDDPDEYPEGGLKIILGRGDVVVGYLHVDGTALPVATDSRFLEPWPRAGGDPEIPDEEDDED